MRTLQITICMITALLTASTATLGGVTEIDTFPLSWGQIQLQLPGGFTETIDLYGTSEIHVFFEGDTEGDANDTDFDGFDEVAAKIMAMNLTDPCSVLGSVVLSLNPNLQSLGEMIETANPTPGTLDLPPFTPIGDANSFFDVFFALQLSVPGILLYNINPARIIATINEKPPAHGDIYQSTADIELFLSDGQPSGYFFGLIQYEPNPAQYDWGDAPDDAVTTRYPTLAVNNGANHYIVPGFMLGASVDAELDGQPNNGATGDDKNGSDDENGVAFVTWPLIPGRPAVVNVTASAAGLLYAWIDFSADDSWAQTGDQIFSALPLAPGANSLIFQVPMTAGANITTFSRFRFTSDPNVSYDGPASDGEVEDHIVKIKERCGIKWVQLPDETENGIDICATNTEQTNRILADDFECKSFGLITDIHLWGSWLNDVKRNITNIQVSIYSDDPAGAGGSDPENSYSKPDSLLWLTNFGPGEFTEQLYATVEPGEYWWDPVGGGTIIPEGDTEIWQIDMYVDRTEAFFQEGTPAVPVIYWLAIRVDATDAGEFGWKTRRWPDQYQDAAVWAVGGAKQPDWHPLIYPAGHPDNPIDLAFIITTDDYCPARADLNCNGSVDLLDFAIFAAQWLQMAP